MAFSEGFARLFADLLRLITEPAFMGGLFVSGILLHRFFHKREKLAVLFVFVGIAILVSGSLAVGLKGFFQVPRPCEGKTLDCPADKSFPSAHATISFAVFSFLFFLNGRWVSSEIILAFPFIISLARVLQGVHTIADISFGALLGTGIGFFLSRAHIFSHSLSEKRYLREAGFFRHPKTGKISPR